MSYQVIARKWRPQRFDEVQGQEHVTRALRNAITTDRVPHALLFTGPRGVGKTTLARLLARCLNCENGPTDDPCGDCASCVEISSGHSTDVQEIDAASRTGVDDMREIIESIRYAASPGKHRIYVIDEVHMLSSSAFNALLKTLEEPPARSLFVFATTDPDKIPLTVLSRCQRYDLRRISTTEVAAHLGSICAAEGVKISEASLRALAREGDGSMRDSQTLLDQIIAFGGTEVADETVAEVLDLVDQNILLAIVEACVDGDAAAALEACQRAGSVGTEPRRLASSLVQLLRDLVVLGVAPDSKDLVEATPEEVERLRALSGRTESARLRRMFRALIKDMEDLTFAPQPFAVLEMAIVRLATMPSGDDVEQLLGRLEQLDRKLAAGGGPAPSGGGRPGGGGSSGSRGTGTRGSEPPNAKRHRAEETPHPRHTATGATPIASAVSSADATPRSAAGPVAVASAAAPERVDPIAAPVETSAAPVAAPDAIDDSAPAHAHASAPPDVIFERLRAFTQKRDGSLFGALDDGQLLERRSGYVKLALSNDFHVKRLKKRDAEVEAACSAFFGERTKVEITRTASAAPEGAAPTSRSPERMQVREAERQRKQTALNHPSINVALEVLEGEIVEIKSLGGGPR